MKTDLVLYEFTRARIAAVDLSDAVMQFSAAHQSGAVLRALHDRVVFCAGGYEAHAEEIFVIAEVRQFLRAFRQACPHWQFFAALHEDSLKAIYAAMLDSVECVQFPRDGMCRIAFDQAELSRLVAADLACADDLCVKIGISPARRLKRATTLVEYLGLTGGAR